MKRDTNDSLSLIVLQYLEKISEIKFFLYIQNFENVFPDSLRYEQLQTRYKWILVIICNFYKVECQVRIGIYIYIYS